MRPEQPRTGLGASMDITMRSEKGKTDGKAWGKATLMVLVLALWVAAGTTMGFAQENPLGEVHTPAPPPPPKTPEDSKPVIEGADNAARLATSRRDARIRVDVNLVLVPATVTDPMNRLVTGLEKGDFQGYDNNIGQGSKSFSNED